MSLRTVSRYTIFWLYASVQLLMNLIMTSFMFAKFPGSMISLTFIFVVFIIMAATAEFVEYFLTISLGSPSEAYAVLNFFTKLFISLA